MSQTPTSVLSQTDRPTEYTLQIIEDTWLKQTSAHSDELADSQKRFVEIGTVYSVTNVQLVEDDHIKITLKADKTERDVQSRGLDTWYVNRPTVQLWKDGQIVSQEQLAIMTFSPSSLSGSIASTYTLRIIEDTWLKQSTAQGATLPDDQRQFIKAGTVLPVSSFQQVENDHLRVAFGLDAQGNQIFFQGRNTWYVYRLAVQLLRNGQVIVGVANPPLPAPRPAPTPAPTASYTVRLLSDTWLKQSTAQGSSLPDAQRQFVNGGMVLPIASYATAENNHLRITLGRNNQGEQLQFKGRNTWYVYRPVVQVLRDGRVILGPTNPPAPAPTPIPSPTPNPPSPSPVPMQSPYSFRATIDTWLKQSTAQSTALPDDQKQLINAGTVLPLAAFQSAPNNHLRITLGTNAQGNQLQFKGRNTWFVYRPAIQLLQNGRPIDSPTPSPTGRRQINADGLRLLKSFEGLRLEAYQDPVGVWTIGYGTTSGVRPGMVITEAEAEALLRRDLARFENAVADLVNVPVNDDQFSALVSFTYNVGEGALASSTLLRLLNQRDYSGAADQLLRWNRAGGAELPGLTRRRRAERALFLGQDYTVFL
jgi:GH24 family phage-related lysozyme (muramidase)